MTGKLIDDCFLTDKDRLRHDDALKNILTRIGAVAPSSVVPLARAAGRILAKPVIAKRDIPGHDNAAVDGFAFAASNYDVTSGTTFPIQGRSAAGHPLREAYVPGNAVRILTGAIMPAGTDTVVMQEDVELVGAADSGWVKVPGGLKRGANRRLAGEDRKAGAQVMQAGRRLRPQDVAAIASAGQDELSCYAPLRVAIISSGDEVIAPGTDLAPGQVYDANSPMLDALVRRAGAQPTQIGVVGDGREEVRGRLQLAAAEHDLLITTGGASRGEEDHMSAVLDELGRRHVWQIAVKPGRPMFFGQIGDAAVLGLPGNPVAAFVCFLLYGRPLIARLAGENWQPPVRFRVRAGFQIDRKKPDRREFWRAHIENSPDGPVARKFARDGSGLISSLTESTGLIEVGEDVVRVGEGDLVDFLPYASFWGE